MGVIRAQYGRKEQHPDALTEVTVYGREHNGRTGIALTLVHSGRDGNARWSASAPVTTPMPTGLKCHADVSFPTLR
jgi:hypothetical protein